jgi:hypothetical protein
MIVLIHKSNNTAATEILSVTLIEKEQQLEDLDGLRK